MLSEVNSQILCQIFVIHTNTVWVLRVIEDGFQLGEVICTNNLRIGRSIKASPSIQKFEETIGDKSSLE